MIAEAFWSKSHFPVVYENNQAKAVIVDMESFEKIQLILDNLLNRESEIEDALFANSETIKKIIGQAKKSKAAANWRTELAEL
ncbi:MAG: hypothetical protein BWK80_31880 [Desulfobacteraceae bacterium IS3]|jgi:hypothetical protein|nr:MAG: hypothetical protein BWK80_31880 [Desulfobacteraceae bacterium IS3]HAO22817.1 hypothetical protein [Desulfobacteraceae bacterium]